MEYNLKQNSNSIIDDNPLVCKTLLLKREERKVPVSR